MHSSSPTGVGATRRSWCFRAGTKITSRKERGRGGQPAETPGQQLICDPSCPSPGIVLSVSYYGVKISPSLSQPSISYPNFCLLIYMIHAIFACIPGPLSDLSHHFLSNQITTTPHKKRLNGLDLAVRFMLALRMRRKAWDGFSRKGLAVTFHQASRGSPNAA